MGCRESILNDVIVPVEVEWVQKGGAWWSMQGNKAGGPAPQDLLMDDVLYPGEKTSAKYFLLGRREFVVCVRYFWPEDAHTASEVCADTKGPRFLKQKQLKISTIISKEKNWGHQVPLFNPYSDEAMLSAAEPQGSIIEYAAPCMFALVCCLLVWTGIQKIGRSRSQRAIREPLVRA
eukprot:gnl/TRDRNA2_/TRDRNA2_91538_c0_seq1.p1 gnl/TRDRNA2_/TRDRNA2_91538_c0~~gnl/TRDRNA2_/TRDRNA2_91538_c0_seq1.p1  ORF type:complete len:177 (-),score=32.63 gnl/TRDRNA2_/TRDRNA2_91538_c0_seq1:152-682(-)